MRSFSCALHSSSHLRLLLTSQLLSTTEKLGLICEHNPTICSGSVCTDEVKVFVKVPAPP